MLALNQKKNLNLKCCGQGRLFAIFVLTLTLLAQTSFAASWPKLSFVPVVTGLESPVHVTHAGDGKGRIFIVEQSGRIRIVVNGVLQPTPFLDIKDRVSCCGERGLFSVAFPPKFATKGYFYVNYTNKAGNTVVSRFAVMGSGDIADPASENFILTIEQPFVNHNGGQIAFGPDGMLYIGMGDGGGVGDPLGSGQDPASLLGKLLRIDVESSAQPYAIRATNPFVSDGSKRPEIWASGLRNPWRFSFDREKGDLFIADVGQDLFEEINFQSVNSPGGENYGWNVMEGNHCFKQSTCNNQNLVNPVLEYDHTHGDLSITGGFVYRGKVFPRMRGIYLFGDFVSGRIAGLRRPSAEPNASFDSALLADTDFLISSFGEDESGEMYVADISGTVFRIEDTVRFSELSFSSLEASYQFGDSIQMKITETSPQRTEKEDLWVAVATPDGQLLYLSNQTEAQWSTQPQPFKREVDPSDTTHHVLSMTLTAGISPGSYHFYAVLNDPNPGMLDLSSSLRSSIAEAVFTLRN